MTSWAPALVDAIFALKLHATQPEMFKVNGANDLKGKRRIHDDKHMYEVRANKVRVIDERANYAIH